VSGSDDTTVRIWDAATGAQRATLIGGRDDEWLAPTPAGYFAASAKATGGWAAIARDGERLGFVPADAVERIQ
jgi:hypothetical protein